MIDDDVLDRLDGGDPETRAWIAAAYGRADADAAHAILDRIAQRAAAGSAIAVELMVQLVHDHRLAHPAIASVLVDPADIDDAAQLTLIAVAERLDRFESRARFRTWLGTVARNEALQVLRRKRRRSEPSGEEVPDAVGFITRLSSAVANEAAVHAALAEVDQPYREALELRELHQLDYEEIAERLGVPIGTVRSRIARARDQLAQQVWRFST